MKGHIWDTVYPKTRATILLMITGCPTTTFGLLMDHSVCRDILNLNSEAKVNALPGAQVLTCKLKLAKRHQEFKKMFGSTEFNFIPETFGLLNERDAILTRMTESSFDCDMNLRSDGEPQRDRSIWIVKPINMSRGRGIFLTESPLELPAVDKSGDILVQKYIADPYLINDHKFDMRVYVLITGADPLKVYVYKDGLVR